MAIYEMATHKMATIIKWPVIKWPVIKWNQYETTLADGISTNNALESWNKGWNSLMGPHPNVWSVIGGFLQQEADARRQIMSNAADLDMRENSGRRSLGEQARA